MEKSNVAGGSAKNIQQRLDKQKDELFEQMKFEQYLHPDSEELDRLGDEIDGGNCDVYQIVDIFKDLTFGKYMDDSLYQEEAKTSCILTLKNFATKYRSY